MVIFCRNLFNFHNGFFTFQCHYLETNYGYTFNTNLLSWESARVACQKEGGDLASVSSQQDQVAITSNDMLKREGTSAQWWIGLSQDNALRWKWSDNTKRYFMVSINSRYRTFSVTCLNNLKFQKSLIS